MHRFSTALAVIIFVGVTVDLALGQGKEVIKVVAMGGTISHTVDGRPAFEQVISDIRENYPETTELLDSVHIEVVNVHSVASSSMSGDQILEIVRVVNKDDSRARGEGRHCHSWYGCFRGDGLFSPPAGQKQQTHRSHQLPASTRYGW